MASKKLKLLARRQAVLLPQLPAVLAYSQFRLDSRRRAWAVHKQGAGKARGAACRGVHLVSITRGSPLNLNHTYWAFKPQSENPLSPLGLSPQSGSRTGVPPFGVLRDVFQHGGVAYLSAPP